MVPSPKLSEWLQAKHQDLFSPEALEIVDAILARVALVDITGHRLVLDDSSSIAFGNDQSEEDKPWPTSSTAGY